jgi:two-component system, cell cycle sensor histidine kinase and response regulator CckA
MTIRQRYYFSLLMVLALFFANLVAYFWSGRARRLAESELNHATACELRLPSIREALNVFNKEVHQTSKEEKPAFLSDENRVVFEKQIARLQQDASPRQMPVIEDLHQHYLQIRQAWLDSYRSPGAHDLSAANSLALADSLVNKVFMQDIPDLQSLDSNRISRARIDFQLAETLGWHVMVATFFLSALIALVLSWRLSRRLTFGFTTLKHGARLIGALELQHRIRYPAKDEFAELATSFNDMAEKLSFARHRLLQTDLRLSHSETRYHNLVDRAVYGIYRSARGRFLDANPALVTMLGCSTKQELLNLDMATDVYADPAEYHALLENLKRNGSVEGFETQWKTRSGKTIITRLSGNVVEMESGGSECEMIAENVTEHRVLEEQLRQSQKMEAVGRLAGGIAHDFNNLLTVIKGHSELLLSELPAGDQTRKEVDGVIRAADRAASLTRQLLAFSRRQLLKPEILDLNVIVSNMEKMLPRLLGEDVGISKVLDPALGMVRADPNQIEQVIMNLAVNARDAMPNGGKLWITTSNLEVAEEFRHGEIRLPPGAYVTLSVKDTGEGMDAATAARAFEPFFTTKESGKGTGLGLSTVYGIVKQSEGEIWVESAPGRGAAFYICFPRIERRAEAVKEEVSTDSPAGKETILIVEDETDVREIASTMLERRGYNVIAAADSHEAQKICRAHPYVIHLMLTDVVLKDAGGLELAQLLTVVRPEMKVIFMSGYTDDVVLKHGIRNSQVAFLPKPFTSQELASKVREVLDRVAVTSQG